MHDIRKVSVFSTLSDEDIAEIGDWFTESSHKKKESIFDEGDPPDWFYMVFEGKVKITKISHEGKEIILEIISPNEIFGAVAVLRGFPYPANAVSMEDSVVGKISRANLMKVLDRFPNTMFCLMQNMSDRIKGSHESLKNIALEKVSSRIASLLIKLSEKAGHETPDGTLIDLKLTKQDIADMVGTTVETSIRTMSQFKKLGLVAEKDGRIIITNAERLRALGS